MPSRRPSDTASSADVDHWTGALRAIAPLDEADLALCRPHLTALELPAGGAFLRAGERAERVGLVRSGVLRESYALADGQERTRGFGLAGDLVGSLSDLLSGAPARLAVHAQLPSRVLCVPWARVMAAATERAAWRELLARVTTRLYLDKSEREYELLALDAAARYERFRERYPGLEALIAQRHVASYLGITPEHLSRLRGRRDRTGPARRRTVASGPRS